MVEVLGTVRYSEVRNMLMEKEFAELRGTILREIASAANRGETVKVGTLARLLADCEQKLSLVSNLTNAAERIEKELSNLRDPGDAGKSQEMRSRPSLPL